MTWHTAAFAFFGYVTILAVSLRALARRQRVACLAAAAIGAAIAAAAHIPRSGVAWQDWIAPAAVLLIAYWGSGQLYRAPMPTAEAALRRLDHDLRVRTWAGRTPSWLVEVLEAAYAGVYLMIPLALIFHLTLSPSPAASRFWLAILMTDFVCFGVLPWVQTRPPRALEPEPWTSRVRTFNLRIVGAASIGVNTFPSGHAAEALIAVLLLTDLPFIVPTLMLVGALAVSAGAVLGRYHFAADVFAGWAVALVVWVWLR
jgi:membrane-associated phospholipid phosphatase